MSNVTLHVSVRSESKTQGEDHRTINFNVKEAPSDILVGDTVEFSNGIFVTVESRSWRRGMSSGLVLGCTIGAIPFEEMFRKCKKNSESESYLETIIW